jgi:TRAP-type C4-dicarboxylate transport system permease small subunit
LRHNLGTGDIVLNAIRYWFEKLLETIVVILVVALTGIVLLAVLFRYTGHSLSWYDEIASIGLVWLTYYGSALAALKGVHIGVAGFVSAMPTRLRVAVTIFAEAIVLVFFVMLAVTGVRVLSILGGDGLVSVPEIPVRLTDSVIPIGATLFVIAELLRLPQTLRDARKGVFIDTELQEALDHAELAAKSGKKS